MNQQVLHFTCELQLKYTLHSNSNKPQELTVINGQSSQLSKSYNQQFEALSMKPPVNRQIW